MSVEQLRSINLRMLEERAKAHSRIRRTSLEGKDARVESFVDGYKAAIADVRKVAERSHIKTEVDEWLEEQP